MSEFRDAITDAIYESDDGSAPGSRLADAILAMPEMVWLQRSVWLARQPWTIELHDAYNAHQAAMPPAVRAWIEGSES